MTKYISKDPYEQCIQYSSIKDGIEAHAEIYSFNIESELFNQLTKEQQTLWRKEIEQACISGSNIGVELARDPRYKENLEMKEVNLDFTKEVDAWINDNGDSNGFFSVQELAKHFYDKSYFNGHIHDGDRIEHVDGRKVNVSRFRRIAKPLEAPVSEELEEAANFYADTHTEWFDADNNPSVSPAFKAGAQWQKEQIMKNAVEGEVDKDYYIKISDETWIDLDPSMQLKPAFSLKKGDKVKMIVIKEE